MIHLHYKQKSNLLLGDNKKANTFGGIIAGVTWGSAAAMAAGAAAGAGGAYLSGKATSEAAEENSRAQEEAWGGQLYKQYPDYPESAGARGLWWDTLQKWGKDPDYGAISPNWDDIWERAKKKVSQYYWGSPTSPGLANKIRASSARRNVSESPAGDLAISRMGVEEAGQLGNLATEQNTLRAQLGETARYNWLNSLMGLSAQKPQYMSRSGVTTGDTGASPLGSALSTVGSGINTYAQIQSQDAWLRELQKENEINNRQEPTYGLTLQDLDRYRGLD